MSRRRLWTSLDCIVVLCPTHTKILEWYLGVDSTTKIGEISVPMQNVCDHQIRKILNFPEVKEKYNQLVESGRQFKLVMYGKYGADGTNTDTEYQNADAGEYSYLNKCLFQRSTM